MHSSLTKHKALFLQGGGETGELIRNFDWFNTSIGLPETWPLEIKTLVQLMLNAALPTSIIIGDSYIVLYNDSFIPILGKTRHPNTLGKQARDISQQWDYTEKLYARVFSGEAISVQDQKYTVDKNGFPEECFFSLNYTPIYNDNKKVIGIHSVVVETTDKINALSKSKEDEFTLRSLIEKAPIAICLFVGRDLTIDFSNDIMIRVLGKGKGVIGKPLLVAVPELASQPFLKYLDDVYTTGKTFEAKGAPAQLEVNGVMGTYYFDFSYIAVYNSSGEIYGVTAMANDVTLQYLALKELEESKAKLDFTIHAAELGTFSFDPITNNYNCNARAREWLGLPNEGQVSVQQALKTISEKDRPLMNAAIEKALGPSSNGNFEIEYTVIHPATKKEIILKSKGKAFFDKNGRAYQFSGTIQDVTEESQVSQLLAREIAEQKIAKAKLEESELFANSVIYNSPVAKIVFIGEDMRVKMANENMLEMIGRNNSILGKTFPEVMPELKDTKLMEEMRHVYFTGETYEQPEEKIEILRFGKPYTGYYNYIYKALRKVSGEIYGVMVTANEVTSHVLARQIVETKEKELRDLITAAPVGICVLSGTEAKIEEVNERFITIFGKQREQFKNSTYWQAFPEVAAPFAPILENIFKTGIKFSTEEAEMTLNRGGKPERIFARFDYVPVFDAHNSVAKVLVIVQEVTHQVETRKKIEEAVAQRTKELAELNVTLTRSNSELEQFAYIASHDLQEPIRKISTFTQMLEHSITNITEQNKNYVAKIYGSTERMTKLIRDVLAFSQISQTAEKFIEVDLSKIIQGVETDFELLIENKQATLLVDRLPNIDAIPSQMTQLFSNLISNSLKYIRPEIKPIIKISWASATKELLEKHPQLDLSKKYHHIEFSDNGIGFDQEHADRIFKIFQRLHGKTEYEGTGIGLSICRKILETHQGHIFAVPGTKGGAVFNILLPESLN